AEHRLIELHFDIDDNLAGVCAVANDDDAADRLAVPIQLGDASAHIRAELDVGHLTQENRNAFLAHTESDLAQVLEAIDVTADAQDEFLFRQLKRAATHLAVAAFDGHGHFRNRKIVGTQFGRIHRDLVLADETANRRHFGDALD